MEGSRDGKEGDGGDADATGWGVAVGRGACEQGLDWVVTSGKKDSRYRVARDSRL